MYSYKHTFIQSYLHSHKSTLTHTHSHQHDIMSIPFFHILCAQHASGVVHHCKTCTNNVSSSSCEQCLHEVSSQPVPRARHSPKLANVWHAAKTRHSYTRGFWPHSDLFLAHHDRIALNTTAHAATTNTTHKERTHGSISYLPGRTELAALPALQQIFLSAPKLLLSESSATHATDRAPRPRSSHHHKYVCKALVDADRWVLSPDSWYCPLSHSVVGPILVLSQLYTFSSNWTDAAAVSASHRTSPKNLHVISKASFTTQFFLGVSPPEVLPSPDPRSTAQERTNRTPISHERWYVVKCVPQKRNQSNDIQYKGCRQGPKLGTYSDRGF